MLYPKPSFNDQCYIDFLCVILTGWLETKTKQNLLTALWCHLVQISLVQQYNMSVR